MEFSSLRRTLIVAILLALLAVADQRLAAEQECDAGSQPFCAAKGKQTDDHDNLRQNHLISQGKNSQDQQQQQQSWNAETSCLRAGVVEHSRVDVAGDCQQSANANLDIYDKVSRIAQENGVKMLVFPEDGIYIGSKTSIRPCLEDIPDPETLDGTNNNPCISASSASTFQKAPILTRLSCIAKRYQLYLVANYGTREQCDNDGNMGASQNGTICPDKSRDFMMLNTNVVFNPQGQFVKRYRKWHPFTESEVFDKAPKLEHTYFDTPHGRFGLFTCFDMIYRDPAVDLVEHYNVDTAIFPTWWFDELPILTAIQFQDGWSATNKVNLLASNILKPLRGSTGSSIFSGNNSLYVSQAHGYAAGTKLLIANIANRPKSGPVCDDANFEPKVVEIEDNQTKDEYKFRNYKLLETDTFETLDTIRGSKRLCSGNFCCTLNYTLSNDTAKDQVERLIMLVRNGHRPGLFRWYEQVCGLSVLKHPASDAAELTKQVIYDGQSGANFVRLSLEANFDSNYVYPSTAHDSSRLIERRQRRLVCDERNDGTSGPLAHNCKLEFVPSPSDSNQDGNKIYSFAMYGRVYERDPAEIAR